MVLRRQLASLWMPLLCPAGSVRSPQGRSSHFYRGSSGELPSLEPIAYGLETGVSLQMVRPDLLFGSVASVEAWTSSDGDFVSWVSPIARTFSFIFGNWL